MPSKLGDLERIIDHSFCIIILLFIIIVPIDSNELKICAMIESIVRLVILITNNLDVNEPVKPV